MPWRADKLNMSSNNMNYRWGMMPIHYIMARMIMEPDIRPKGGHRHPPALLERPIPKTINPAFALRTPQVLDSQLADCTMHCGT